MLAVFWNSWKHATKRSVVESFYQINKIGILTLIKKSLHSFFRGCSEKILFWKFRKIPRKAAFIEFLLSKLSVQSVTYSYTEIWLHHKLFLVSVSRIFKIAVRASVVKSLFRKVACKISAFYKSARNYMAWNGMFRI